MTDPLSLVVCTLGRTEPLVRLFESLRGQAGEAFEVVVVDQNPDGYLQPCLERFPDLPIRRVVSERGLSRARNVGLRASRGSIVGFPDDDCWYGPGVAARVRETFRAGPDIAVLTGRTLDVEGRESLLAHRAESGWTDRSNVFQAGSSSTLFVRAAVAREVAGFDETLGLGAGTPFQSGEETDFILRVLAAGHRAFYDRDFTVFHDQSRATAEDEIKRARLYSVGYGRVLRTHGYGPLVLAERVGRTVLRGAVCLATGDRAGARRRYSWALGALKGYAA